MIEFKLVPLVAAGPFVLGTSRAEIRSAAQHAGLELSHERGELDFFADNSIQVEYDSQQAQFVGVSSNPGRFTVTFHGQDVFDMAAPELFELIKKNEASPGVVYDAKGVTFETQIVTLWDADEQYDRVRRRADGQLRVVWAQVGLGTPRYLELVAPYLA